MNKRKGQFVSMIAVVALLFISGGNLFTAMFVKQTFGDHVHYYSKDIGNVMEARVEGTFYNYTVRKEMNFTENNVAYKMRQKNRHNYDWTDGTVPLYSTIKSTFEDNFINPDTGLRSQDFVAGCTGPGLSLESLTKNGINVEMSDKSIKCGARDAGTYSFSTVYFAQENPDEKTLRVENTQNRWLSVAETSVDLGEGLSSGDFSSHVPEGETRDGSATWCKNPDFNYGNPPPASDLGDGFAFDASVKYSARQNARNKFLNDYRTIAREIFSGFDKNGHSWISADTGTYYPDRKTKDYTRNEITSRDINSCTADDCTSRQFDDWEHDQCDYNNDGDINYTDVCYQVPNKNSDGTHKECDTNPEAGCIYATSYGTNYSQCDYDKGTSVTAKATYAPKYVNMTYNIYDSKKKIRTKKGMKTARFKMNYTKVLN